MVKVLGESTGEKPHDVGLGSEFMDMTPKARAPKQAWGTMSRLGGTSSSTFASVFADALFCCTLVSLPKLYSFIFTDVIVYLKEAVFFFLFPPKMRYIFFTRNIIFKGLLGT